MGEQADAWTESLNQLEAYYYLFVEETFDLGGTLAYALRILKNSQIYMNHMYMIFL